MKINMRLNDGDSVREELLKLGVENDEQSDYILMKKDGNQDYLSVRAGNGKAVFVRQFDIVYIESFGHDIIVHTSEAEYKCSERLKALEAVLDENDFFRISNSCIVARAHITKIEASLFRKFVLRLSSGVTVEVTRSYYLFFKEKMGI